MVINDSILFFGFLISFKNISTDYGDSRHDKTSDDDNLTFCVVSFVTNLYL